MPTQTVYEISTDDEFFLDVEVPDDDAVAPPQLMRQQPIVHAATCSAQIDSLQPGVKLGEGWAEVWIHVKAIIHHTPQQLRADISGARSRFRARMSSITCVLPPILL